MSSASTTRSTDSTLRAIALAAHALGLLLLSGCGVSSSVTAATAATSGSAPAAPTHYQGSVFGGQQPVSGATIQLYTVGTASNGSASNPLISNANTVTTNNAGFFSITGKYNCNTATEVYLVATGGSPGGSSTNANLSLMAALGPCSALSSSTTIQVNEVTTVAAAYALAPFMKDYADIGAAPRSQTGLVNAFNLANLLVSSTTGGPPTPPAGVTLPSTTIYTLADILAACVNSSGLPGSSACQQLFSATGATETIGAALAMAQNPGSPTITALYSLAATSPPFVPALASPPNDFTLSLKYSSAALASPYGIAFDPGFNAWVTNESGSTVVKVPPPTTSLTTTSYSGGGTISAPRGISISCSGNVWIANTGGNDVVELTTSGTLLSGTGYTSGGISGPVSVAVDPSGNAWVANFTGNSLTEYNSVGVPNSLSPFTGSGVLNAPSSVAVDNTGRVLEANSGDGQLCIFANSGSLQGCVNDGLLFGPTAVAVSTIGAVSLAGSTTGTTLAGAFTLATTSGTVNASSPVVATGGLALPSAVAYDGNGNAWFANTSSISEFSGATAVSPSTGYGSLNSPAGIAVDPSGNVWTTNVGDNSLSIFVGLAASTPVAACVGGNVH